MHIVLHNHAGAGTLILTDATAAGRPTLRSVGSPSISDGDYSPSDRLGVSQYALHAAEIVFHWALARCRTDTAVEAVDTYLRQWPDGPQIEEIGAARADPESILTAAAELNESSESIDEMSPEALADDMRNMIEQLGEHPAESPHAYVLRFRSSIATAMLLGHYVRAASVKKA